MRRLAVLASLLVLAVPAAADAQTPPAQPPPGQPGTAPPPPPPPPQAGGTMRLSLTGASRQRGRLVALPGQRMRVAGTVRPFVAGQQVVVRVDRGSRRLLTKALAIRDDGGTGRFAVTFASGKPGRVRVRAVHEETPQQRAMEARAPAIQVLRARARPGAGGPAVRLLQRRLAALGYAVPLSGRFDGGTGRALIAFRKVNGMRRVPSAGVAVLSRLARGKGGFRVRFPSHGKHVEADLSRQVLVLAVGSRVQRIYHMASGAPGSPTIRGSFRFYSKTPGTNAKGMVNSSYFRGGYAVHGYPSVPTGPASHGCLRVPIPNALSIFRWIRLGDRIDVYS